MFLKMSQYSQQNTCVGVSFSEIVACNFTKINSGTGVFLWILQNFKEHIFSKTSANGCFWDLIKVIFDLSEIAMKNVYFMCILLCDCTNTVVIKAKIHYMINHIQFVRLSCCIKKNQRHTYCKHKCDFLFDFCFYIMAVQNMCKIKK